MTSFSVTPYGDDALISASALAEDESVRTLEAADDGAIEQIKVLLEMEKVSYPQPKDYLAAMAASPVNSSDRVSEAWRRKLCEWCYEVVDHFDFDREVVSIALNYLDRAVAAKTATSDEIIPKREFQLLAVTCLYTAIKVHGESDSNSPKRKLKIEAFAELSRGYFQVETIESMELTILDSLDWRMNPPTMVRFVTMFTMLCPKWTSDQGSAYHHALSGVFEVARYLSELSVCVSKFTFNHKASVISYASILCALEALQSTVALPYDVRVAFLNHLAEVTGLVPEMEQVRLVRDMLKEVCPSMFENEEVPPEFLVDRTSTLKVTDDLDGCGKASPVCVVDGQQQESSQTCRKRSRTSRVEDITGAVTNTDSIARSTGA